MFEIDLVLRNAAAHGSHICRVQRGITSVSAKYAEDANALVRAPRRALTIDGIHRSRDRGRESDAVLCVSDVIVHRLGHRKYLHSVSIEFGGVAARVVAP